MGKFLNGLLAFFLLASPIPAAAQDELFGETPPPEAAAPDMDAGLYDPLPPPGSAFVRFLNSAGGLERLTPSANGKSYDELKSSEISPYFVVPRGSVRAGFGDAKENFEIAEGKFYTLVLKADGGLHLLDDPVHDNRARAQIIFYNLSGEDGLALKTMDGGVEIVPALSSGESAAQQINPVAVELAVYSGDAPYVELGSVSLERGLTYSAIALPEDTELLWVQSATDTKR